MIRGLAVLGVVTISLGAGTTASAQSVYSLIKRNSETLTQSTNRITQSKVIQAETPSQAVTGADLPQIRFWPHVRSDEQNWGLAGIIETVRKGVPVNGADRSVKVQATQIVDFGPSEAQLRFFKPSDRESAEALAGVLGSNGLTVRVVDLSEVYKTQSWIKVGHFELWLAPGRN